MENLITRWKSSLNSAKKSLGASGVHSSQQHRSSSQHQSDKKNKLDNSVSSSSDDEYYERKKFIATLKKDMSLTNSRSASSLNKADKAGSPRHPYTTETDTLATSGSKVKDHGSDKKPPRGKKSLAMILDENTYKIMDIFKYNVDLPNQEKFLRIRKLLEDLVDTQGTRQDEEEQYVKLKQESMKQSLVSRADTSSKIIGELESRLFESERERIAHRNEKEATKEKCAMLEKEIKMRNLNEDLVEMVKSNQIILEKNNESLLRELDNCNKRYQEQQIIWENEVNELAKTIGMLKSQLLKTDL